jgi:hypothetical protein
MTDTYMAVRQEAWVPWNFVPRLITQATLVGPDGKPGTGDEVIDKGPDGILGSPDDPRMTVTIPINVYCYISGLPGGPTVANLLELANLALANQLPVGITVTDVNVAVSAVNNGFDRCRFLVGCTGSCPAPDQAHALQQGSAIAQPDQLVPTTTAPADVRGSASGDGRAFAFSPYGLNLGGEDPALGKQKPRGPQLALMQANSSQNAHGSVDSIERRNVTVSAGVDELLFDTRSH